MRRRHLGDSGAQKRGVCEELRNHPKPVRLIQMVAQMARWEESPSQALGTICQTSTSASPTHRLQIPQVGTKASITSDMSCFLAELHPCLMLVCLLV